METYLGYVQAVANQLPVESLASNAIHWMHSNKLLENPSTIIFSGFNKQSIHSTVQIASRAVGAYFFYPRVSNGFSLINASIGIVHLGIGFTQRFRTTEKYNEAPETWNSIALNIHKGFVHLLVAGYDFGIGFLLQQKYIGLAGVAAFAFLPGLAAIYHEKVFRKPGTAPLTTQTVEEQIKGGVDFAKQKLGSPLVQVVASQLPTTQTDSELPPAPKEPEKVIPTYLDPSCLIYIIAKKITLELMPAIESPAEKEVVPTNTKIRRSLSRLSGIGTGNEPPLPSYGL